MKKQREMLQGAVRNPIELAHKRDLSEQPDATAHSPGMKDSVSEKWIVMIDEYTRYPLATFLESESPFPPHITDKLLRGREGHAKFPKESRAARIKHANQTGGDHDDQ